MDAGSFEPVERNIQSLSAIYLGLAADLMGDSAAFSGEDGTIIPLTEPAAAMLSQKAQDTRLALDALPTRIEQVANLIKANGLALPIDLKFVSSVVDGLGQIPKDVDEAAAQEQANSLFLQNCEALELRQAEKEVIGEMETTTSVIISGERTIGIVLSPAQTHVRLELPYNTSPNEFPVELGPNAVDEILGGKLTDEDYAAIHSALVTLPGEAGIVLARYQDAVSAWANEYETRGEALEFLAVQRFNAAKEVHRVFSSSPHDDIALYAISTTIIRRHGLDFPTPQPYSD